MTETTHWTEEEARRRFQRYPEYRDSDIEWLPGIPAHWNSTRLRFVVETRLTKKEVSTLNPETEVSFVPMEAIREYGGLSLDSTKPLSEVLDAYTYFRDGDVIVAKITPCFENGKGALAKGLSSSVGFGTTELHVLRPSSEVEARFLLYLTFGNHFRLIGEASMYGAGGQKRISGDFVRNFRHPLPSFFEQQAIADFLDRETAKIDALVEKKERLIELLQEKRTALITRAVTRGLDPSAASRTTESHVFPVVPKDWVTCKIRRLIRQVKRPLVVRPDVDYREIGIRSWGKGIFHKEPVRGILLGNKSVFRPEPGDFVLNIVFAWEGAVAVATQHEEGMIASHRFPTFRPSAKVDLDYLLMVFQCDQGRRLLEVNSPGAAGRNRTLRISQFLDEEIPLPSVDAQRAAVSAFRGEEKRLAALLRDVRQAISLLHEYRTALISAAVTGKIDVRETTPR